MRTSSYVIGLTFLAASLGCSLIPGLPAQAQGSATLLLVSCEAGAKIDGTTAAQVMKLIKAAGYTDVMDLNKGCDNVWHGSAVDKDGVRGNILVTPEGKVLPEGN
jgi:hypothetical protein